MRQPERVAMPDLSTSEEKETVLVEKQQNFGKAAIGFGEPINTLWTE